MSHTDRRIAPGGIILVTGANGYIATHIVDVLLEQGYNVRGTVRAEKRWLNDFFDNKYGKGRFETRIVKVLEEESAFDGVLKDVSGIIHTATETPGSPDASSVIPRTIARTLNVLKAAAKEPSIKSVVLTSSSTAALLPVANKDGIVVTTDTWNDDAVKAAYSEETPQHELPYIVYAASKTEGERAFWEWVKASSPDFAVNTVLPDCAFGEILMPEIPGSSMACARDLLEGKTETNIEFLSPQWCVNVRDIARVHIAALLDPTVQNERLFAFAEPFNWTDVIKIFRKLRPENEKIPQAPENEGRDLSDVWKPSKRTEELIRSFFRVKGWIPLEVTLEEGIADLK